MIVQAKPGSGQTLAFGLPILSLLDPDARPQALVLTTNRDRCMRMWDTLAGLGADAGLEVQALHSGFALAIQEKALRRRVDVVVGTPGRVKDLAASKRLDLSKVRIIVLDNAEELYYEGLHRDVEFLMERCTGREQTLIFTEAMPDGLAALAKRYMAEPELVRLTGAAKARDEEHPPTTASATVEASAAEGLYFVRLGEELPLDTLLTLMKAEAPKRALVYAASRQELKRLAQQIERATTMKTGCLTRDMSPHARNSMIGRFRAGDHRVLVVHQQVDAEIEVDELTHVFHLDTPEGDMDASTPVAGVAPHRKTIMLIPLDGEDYLAALCDRLECEELHADGEPVATPAPAPRKAAESKRAPAAAGPEREPRRRNRLGATRAPSHGQDPGALLTQDADERSSTGPLAPLPRMRMSWETFKVALIPGKRPSRDSVHAWLADSSGVPRSCLRSIMVFADYVTVEVESKEIEKFRAGFQDKFIS
ncbi:MAG: ATP-dependent helicase/autoaggregation-mediating protein [Cyanobacteria bacterium RYN_339]|nr:ATP-dependent helicase/autoaggregation-mediating protein [Cyanobacteria bacterium RYN_339]